MTSIAFPNLSDDVCVEWFCARYSRVSYTDVRVKEDMAVLASLVAQARGVMFYDLQASGACYGDRVYLVRRPQDRYDMNCLDVMLLRGRFMLGHLEAGVAASLSPLMRDAFLEMSG